MMTKQWLKSKVVTAVQERSWEEGLGERDDCGPIGKTWTSHVVRAFPALFGFAPAPL